MTTTTQIADIDSAEIQTEAPAARIAAARDLDILCEVLNGICEETPEGRQPDYGPYLTSRDLPTYGGEEPTDTMGVYSWDAMGLLVPDAGGPFCRRTGERPTARRPWAIRERV